MTLAELRRKDQESIRSFVETCSSYLHGRVLDYGCGKQPYREFVSGEYVPYDREDFPDSQARESYPVPEGQFDAVLCTQVIELTADPQSFSDSLFAFLLDRCHLILTYPSAYPQFCDGDFLRFTAAGMRNILQRSGFTVIDERMTHAIEMEDFNIPVGYGVVARR